MPLTSTWSTAREVILGRAFILRGKDRGRPSWQYVLLDDDAEKIKNFNHKIMEESFTIDARDYGTILRSGWGKDPSQEDKDWIYRALRLSITPST